MVSQLSTKQTLRTFATELSPGSADRQRALSNNSVINQSGEVCFRALMATPHHYYDIVTQYVVVLVGKWQVNLTGLAHQERGIDHLDFVLVNLEISRRYIEDLVKHPKFNSSSVRTPHAIYVV
jgi:hypothetical protein